jgi:hypothetical protein
MTGHTPNSATNQGFLSTMHSMIDDLDTISSNIDENTYLRLVNGLQRLYNIHNSSNQTSSTNYETLNQRHHERYRLASLAIHHDYEGIHDISGNPMRTNPNPIISNANSNSNSSPNSIISSVFNNNNNYDSWNENNPVRIQENARISYTALYTNASDYWNQALFQENVIAR